MADLATILVGGLSRFLGQKSELELWEKEGGISLSVTSNGVTGNGSEEEIMKKASVRFISNQALRFLSTEFIPSCGITTQVVIFPGSVFRQVEDRTIQKMLNLAQACNLVRPSLELTWLICQALTRKKLIEMKLSKVIIMHDPFNGSTQKSWRQCYMSRDHIGSSRIVSGNSKLLSNYGYAFVVDLPPISPNN